MKNLIKGLTLISFIALTACQKGMESSSTISPSSDPVQAAVVTQELQSSVTQAESNVSKMESDVDASLKELDQLFASIQSSILANSSSSNSSSSSSGSGLGGILGSIGSIILGGFNPISLILGGINLITSLFDNFSGSSGSDLFANFQSSFNDIFANVETVVTQAKTIVSDQRALVVAQLALLDQNNPAQAQIYQQLMGIMNQLDSVDQKIITKVADFNTRSQTFMNQVQSLQQSNSSSGIGSLAGSFLQNFGGIIGQAVQTLLGIL